MKPTILPLALLLGVLQKQVEGFRILHAVGFVGIPDQQNVPACKKPVDVIYPIAGQGGQQVGLFIVPVVIHQPRNGHSYSKEGGSVM